jgi:Tfp pilus assembly protein PilO
MMERDRRALTIGAVVLVLMLGYAWAVKPALSGLARDRDTLAEQRALLMRERALLAAAPSMAPARKAAQEALARTRPRLFDGDSVAATAQLASFVTEVASATGVQLANADSRSPASQGGVAALSVDIRGEGSWRQLLTFLRAIESSSRLVEVSQLRLERGARGGPLGGDLISLAATVKGYGRAAP